MNKMHVVMANDKRYYFDSQLHDNGDDDDDDDDWTLALRSHSVSSIHTHHHLIHKHSSSSSLSAADARQLRVSLSAGVQPRGRQISNDRDETDRERPVLAVNRSTQIFDDHNVTSAQTLAYIFEQQ